MRAVMKSRLIVVVLSILLLCTTVPSTTSCESTLGTGAVVVGVIAVVYVAYWVVYALSSPQHGETSSTYIDPRLASISLELPQLIEQQQDLVIRNELDCTYEIYVDGAYRCEVGPRDATSLKIGVGVHDTTLLRSTETASEPEAPRELQQRFEVLDDEGFVFAKIQYSCQ